MSKNFLEALEEGIGRAFTIPAHIREQIDANPVDEAIKAVVVGEFQQTIANHIPGPAGEAVSAGLNALLQHIGLAPANPAVEVGDPATPPTAQPSAPAQGQ